MEEILLNNKTKPKRVRWCSGRVSLKKHFENYYSLIHNLYPNCHTTMNDICRSLLPNSPFSDKDFKTVLDNLNVKKIDMEVGASLSPNDSLMFEEIKPALSTICMPSTSKQALLSMTNSEDSVTTEQIGRHKKKSEVNIDSEHGSKHSTNQYTSRRRKNKKTFSKCDKEDNEEEEIVLDHVKKSASAKRRYRKVANKKGRVVLKNKEIQNDSDTTLASDDEAEEIPLERPVKKAATEIRRYIKMRTNKGSDASENEEILKICESMLSKFNTPEEQSIPDIASSETNEANENRSSEATKSGPQRLDSLISFLSIDTQFSSDKSSSPPGSQTKTDGNISCLFDNGDKNTSHPSVKPANSPVVSDDGEKVALRRSSRTTKPVEKFEFQQRKQRRRKTKEIGKIQNEARGSDEESEKLCVSEIVHNLLTEKGANNRMWGRKHRGQILVDTTNRLGKKDLIPRKNFIVTFRVHKPFHRKMGSSGIRPGKCVQEINVLNFQTLDDLRGKIVCEADCQDTAGECSDWPFRTSNKVTLSSEVYRSCMFYIDNSFYVDTSKGLEDYSQVIKEWAEGNNINLGSTYPIDQVKMEDMTVRFGYPYVYMHQGSCEHLIIVSDARFLTEDDSLHSSDYPNLTKISRTQIVYCVACVRYPAEWVVMFSDRMMFDTNYMCNDCFFSYHYIGAKKIGKFKAYRWKQKALISF